MILSLSVQKSHGIVIVSDLQVVFASTLRLLACYIVSFASPWSCCRDYPPALGIRRLSKFFTTLWLRLERCFAIRGPFQVTHVASIEGIQSSTSLFCEIANPIPRHVVTTLGLFTLGRRRFVAGGIFAYKIVKHYVQRAEVVKLPGPAIFHTIFLTRGTNYACSGWTNRFANNCQFSDPSIAPWSLAEIKKNARNLLCHLLSQVVRSLVSLRIFLFASVAR